MGTSKYFAANLSRPWLSLLFLSYLSCLLSSVVSHKNRKPPAPPRPALTVLAPVAGVASAISVFSVLLASKLDPVPSVDIVPREGVLAAWLPVIRGRRRRPARDVFSTVSKRAKNTGNCIIVILRQI